jgi:RimJ/RimL family protein N-acetyltransferase
VEKRNISLREIQFDDWKEVHEYASQERVCTYQPWGPNSEDDTRTFVRMIIEDTQKVPRTRFAFVVTIQEGSKIIGAGEVNIRDIRNLRGEISYIINPQFWRNGYATETARLLLHFGFTRLKLHRIYATCDPRNIASSKVLEKVGMKYEGRMRDTLLIRDGWRDSLIYSILEDEQIS